MHAATIASYLPSKEDQEAVFEGVKLGSPQVTFTPELAMLHRHEERRTVEEDAKKRKFGWSAELKSSAMRRLTSDDDADGESDPDFKQPHIGAVSPVPDVRDEADSVQKHTRIGRMVR